MREIKFKFWDKEKKEFPTVLCLADAFKEYEENLDRYVPLQYTGIKDKNGREIFEGDVVKYKNEVREDIIAGIYYDVECSGWRGSKGGKLCDLLHDYKLEIIGNIYQDSNLFKQHE